MKILVLNGSPRKGNSVAAINAFVGGASKKHEVEVVDAYQLKVSPCMICQLTDAFPDHISPRLLLVTD